MQHPFKLKNAALLMALAAIYPMAAHSAAGVAQFAIGDVNVRRGGAAVPLAKGQTIDSGDSIVTGSAGQAQIRFSDGGLVSLAPNSQFNIDKYADENDPTKDSFAVSFLRGGMRAITGLIGKRQRENYKITTNTATIGIRGSAVSAKINNDGTMDVAGEQDGIEVCTNAGCVSLIVGEIVRVNDGNSLPVRTAQRSNVPPLAAREDLFVPENPIRIAQITLPEQTPPVVVPEPPQLINGILTGVSAMFAFGDSAIDAYPRGGQDPSDGVGTFVNSQMTRHEGSYQDYFVTAPLNGTTSVVEKTSPGEGSFGTVGKADDPGFVDWGYWDAGRVTYSGVADAESISPPSGEVQGVHYIVGRPTPEAQMPVTGTASYSLIGGTRPTAWDGETLRIGDLVGAGLNVDFTAGRVNGFVNTVFHDVEGSSVAVQVSGYGYVNGSTFYADGYGNGYAYGSGLFYGFFTGNGAAFAGMVYEAADYAVGYVRGSAVLGKSGTGEEFSTQSGMSAMFATANGDIVDGYPRGGQPYSTGTGYFVGKQLYLHDDGEDGCYYCYTGISTVFAAQSPVSSFGALGNPSDPDFVGWGYWAKGKQTAYDGESSFAGVHYIVGRPTPSGQMPSTGTANYSLAGGTDPTAYDYDTGTVLVGQLVSGGLNVDFGRGRVSAYINTLFSNGTVPVQISGSGSVSQSYFYGYGSDDGGDSYFDGYFIGDQANRAGMVYTKENTPVGEVHGAAAFEKGATGSGMSVLFTSGDGFLFDFSPRGGPYSGNSFFIGNSLFQHDGYSGSSEVVSTRGPVSSAGSLGNVGDADFIGWGYWAKGRSTAYGGSSITDVHYLVGKPTLYSQMPVTGTSEYVLAGGTNPTATMNGTTLVGTLLSTSTLHANFSTGIVNATIDTRFVKNNVTVPVTITDTADISGSRFYGQNCNIFGFFAGNLATRAGLLYNKSDGTVGDVRGAAVFTRSVSSGLSVGP